MKELIHGHVYKVESNVIRKAKASDKCGVIEIQCSNKNNCELYKKGMCVLRSFSFTYNNNNCPYGEHTERQGYTKKAMKYWDFIEKNEERFKDLPKLKEPVGNRIYSVGDYYFVSFYEDYIDSNMPRGNDNLKGVFNSNSFMKKENLNLESLEKFINTEIFAAFGGEIKEYKEKFIPNLFKNLSTLNEELFNEIVQKYPDYEKFREVSFVGRTAKLHSLNKNITVKIKRNNWFWDGEYLVSKDLKPLFLDIDSNEHEFRIKPSKDFCVVVTDDNQVNDLSELL